MISNRTGNDFGPGGIMSTCLSVHVAFRREFAGVLDLDHLTMGRPKEDIFESIATHLTMRYFVVIFAPIDFANPSFDNRVLFSML